MSLTIVAQLRLARDYSVDARDGAEIFVDGPKVMIRHVLINRPWHYLETSPVERRREAAPGGGAGTGRVEVIHVLASPDDLHKLRKRVTTFRPPGFIRRQIAGEDVGERTWPRERAEVPAATQVGRSIDLFRLAKVGISSGSEFSRRAC